MFVTFSVKRFINDDEDAFSPVVRDAGDLGILLGNAFGGIYYKNGHIRALYRRNGTNDHVFLKFFLYLVLTPKARGIYKDIFPAFMLYDRIYRISRGTRDIGNYEPVLADELINDRALSDIGLSDYGDLRPVIFLISICIFGKMSYDFVK